ncbi:MAG TPA: winged helix-turn-helix domain-containing protein [Vicinamibacterales bacterium]
MIYKFGVFEFDSDTKELRKNGRAAALEPQPAKALALLVSRPGEIISREELRDAVWGSDTHVDFDRGLAYCISQIRSALGDSGENPRFIQTVPKKGFKFIAPIEPASLGATGSGGSRGSNGSTGSKGLVLAGAGLIALVVAGLVWLRGPEARAGVVIAVSVFDNETGNPEFDRRVAGLSDLVVERLTKLDPGIAVVGNAAILRQPRNIRNLKAVAEGVRADYVLLGQLQQGEGGLRFITHFIRLSDEAHLRANRLQHFEQNLDGLEDLVVEEFERATREHVLKSRAN